MLVPFFRSGRTLAMGGALIASAFLAIAWLAPERGGPAFMIAVAVGAGGYVIAALAIAAGVSVSRRMLLMCAVAAVVWRMPLLWTPPIAAHDAVRYVWDARVQRAGLNPYETRPDDPALEHLHTPLTRTVDAAWLPTIYPPVAQLYFRAVSAVNESILAFRIAALASDAGIMTALTLLLRALGRPPAAMLLYAWHPLPALEGASGGHVDVFGALLLVLAALALARRWIATATLAFAAAVLVKPLPLVLLPLLWRRVPARHVLLAVASMAALTAWIGRGALPLGSTAAFLDDFRFNGPLFAFAESVLAPRAIAAAAVAVGLVVAAAQRRDEKRFPWAWPLGAALLLSPVIYPWYLVWMIPGLATSPAIPMLMWSVSILSVYGAWHDRELLAPLEVSTGLLVVEFAPVLIAAIWLAAHRYRHHHPRLAT
ncbi:MAG: hypothetical protein WD690_10665 [Vicinamibacterales bacterium]